MIYLFMDKFLVGIKAFVKNKNDEILVLKRTSTAPSNPNTWDLPGGLLDFGETPSEAIKREIFEESSLKINDVKIHSETLFKRKEIPTVVIFYECETINSEEVKTSFEHSEFKWVSISEIKEIKMQPWITEHLLTIF